MKVAIVYHSGFGHTQMVAEHIAKGVAAESVTVKLFNVTDPGIRFEELNEADTIVFGSLPKNFTVAITASFTLL